MRTVVQRRLGPADHGRPLVYEEYATAAWEEGYQYELIDGKLYVSPQPNAPQGRIEKWLYTKLDRYAAVHPEVINYVYNKARVFIPDRPGVTVPEPDVAAYQDYPLDLPLEELAWQTVDPLLVGEVLSLDDPEKDLVRNVALYVLVPRIREYWVIDTRISVSRPTLIVYRRRGQRWQRPITIPFGGTYITRLLPGFELLVDPYR